MDLPNDANLIATFHHYEPFDFTHQGADWVTPSRPRGLACCNSGQVNAINLPFDIAQSWSEHSGYPVYLGEFGAYGSNGKGAALPDRVNYTRIVREEAAKRGIAWAYWEMASGHGVYDIGSGRTLQDLVKALIPG
jgi:endoglucanase